jgi:hypothetical protein
MAGRNAASLVRYAFGIPGRTGTGLRINPVITGAMTGISLLLLLWLSASHMPFDVNVRLVSAGEPNLHRDGSVTNVYELSFRNRGADDLELEIAAGSPELAATVSPSRFVLKQGQDVVRVPAAVTVRAIPANASDLAVSLLFRSRKDDTTVTETVLFMLPEKR